MGLETVVIKIVGDSKELNKTINQLEKVGKVDRQNASSFKKTSKQMSSGFDGLKKKAMALGATMLGAFAIQQIVGSAINTLKNFEKELSTLQSITGSTAEEMEFFQQAAKDVGQSTKTSATEVVKAFTMIGSAQPELLKNGKALAEVTKQALILSKAAGIDATSAATALTSAMNQFGVSAGDAAKFTDIFATSQQKGSSFIEATSEALKNTGAAANAAGLSFETTNAAIQALAKGSLVGSEAGTALRGVLIKLSSQSDEKINPSMVGLGKTITELAKRNLTLSDATKLVGQEGATGLLTLIKQRDTYFELDGALNNTGNALEQMSINTNNLDGHLDELSQAWEQFMLSMQDSDSILSETINTLTSIVQVFSGVETEAKNMAHAIGITDDQIDQMIEDGTVKNWGDLLNIVKDKYKELGMVMTEAGAVRKVELAGTISTTEAIKRWRENLKKRKGITEEAIVVDKVHAKTIGELKIELKDLQDSQNSMVKDSDEYNKAQTRIVEIQKIVKGGTKEVKTEFELLQGVISKLQKELQDQALAGDIDAKTLEQLEAATDKLTNAQRLLKVALGETTKELAPDKDAHAEAMLQRDEENRRLFLSKELQGRFAKETVQLAKDTGQTKEELAVEFANSEFETFKEFEEKKRDEIQKTTEENDTALDTRFQKLEETLGAVSEIQQRASEVFAASTTRKLILIDNEEAKALQALEEQGLGEEALANRKKEIQKDFAEDRAKVLRKQAIADKAAALIQIGIDTALGIMKTIGNKGFLGLPFAIIIGAMGAAQAAIVAATPIPEFHEGKKPELKDGEMFAKILKSESVIPPEQSKKYKGAIDSMIDKKFENYVFHEYMLPMMKSMGKKDTSPYNDVHLWNNQKKQIKLMQENNVLAKTMIKTLDNTNLRRSWK